MKKMFALIGLTAALGVSAAFTQDSATPGQTAQKAKVGEAAPAFTLQDHEGNDVSLSDFEGKIVVLQWVNEGCPVCRRVLSDGTVKSMREELKELDKDFVHLAINSTKNTTAVDTHAYLKKNGFEFTGLDDSAGTVGRLYDARTTPHLYVIDTEGVLRYAGAIDNGARGRADTNYVVNAVKQILAGETVSPDTTKPYGCNVKYAN